MSKTISLYNNRTFLFIFTFIISLILIIIYDVINPYDPGVPPFFVPFPKGLNPSSYYEEGASSSCNENFPVCNDGNDFSPELDCNELCNKDPNVICKQLPEGTQLRNNKDGAIDGSATSQFKADGKKSYCVNNSINDVNCNRFTSTMIWNGETNSWTCECKYPDLYAEEGGGCISKKACLNTSEISENLVPDQTKNRLVATKYAEEGTRNLSKSDQITAYDFKTGKGDIWDPTDPDSKPHVLKWSPYTCTPETDDPADIKSGKCMPWFKCECDRDNSTIQFTALPDDPYSCHIDPCWSSYSHIQAALENADSGMETTDGKICGFDSSFCACDCTPENAPPGVDPDAPVQKVPHEIHVLKEDEWKYPPQELTCDAEKNCYRDINSDFGGQCFVVKDQCGLDGTTFDLDTGTCQCAGEGAGSERKCQSSYVNRGTNLPFCKNPLNVIGSECQSCFASYCANGSTCLWGLLHSDDKWPQQICGCPDGTSSGSGKGTGTGLCYEGCNATIPSCTIKRAPKPSPGAPASQPEVSAHDHFGGFDICGNKAILDNRCINKSCQPGTLISQVNSSWWWGSPTWKPISPDDQEVDSTYWNEQVCPGGIACPIGSCSSDDYMDPTQPGCVYNYECASPFITPNTDDLPNYCCGAGELGTAACTTGTTHGSTEGTCTNLGATINTNWKCNVDNTNPNDSNSCRNQTKTKLAECIKPGPMLKDENTNVCTLMYFNSSTDPGVDGSFKRGTRGGLGGASASWCCGRQTDLSGEDAFKIGDRGQCFGKNIKTDPKSNSDWGNYLQNPDGTCFSGLKGEIAFPDIYPDRKIKHVIMRV